MADILIRGMEMPGHCLRCPLRDNDDDHCVLQPASAETDTWEFQRKHCPLLPLPEGHGRLIDADALIRDKSGEATLWCGYEYQDHSIIFEEDIRNALTIVPAEGGKADEKPV